MTRGSDALPWFALGAGAVAAAFLWSRGRRTSTPAAGAAVSAGVRPGGTNAAVRPVVDTMTEPDADVRQTPSPAAGTAISAGVAAGGGAAINPAVHPVVQTTIEPGAGTWVFPVPTLGDRRASIANPFPAWLGDPKTVLLGVDLMFPRRDTRDLIALYPPGTPNGNKGYFMPDAVAALAASSGEVIFAAVTGTGGTVTIRHANGWCTYYTYLSTLAVARGAVVAAGTPLGTIGASPLDAAHLKRLHFEIWPKGVRAGAVDPARHLRTWSRVAIPTWTPTAPSTSTPRNAGLVYRPVGDTGDRYPDWLQRARGASGVYVIRERGGGPIVYVGQSSAGKLYETVTRHLQQWRRYKGYWRGQYAEGHDPGLTYDRARVEIAIKLTAPDEALDEEARLIRRLQPRDNLLGQPEPALEEAPF